MANQYGNNIKLSIYGGSHDTEIGVRLSGFPANFSFDEGELLAFIGDKGGAIGEVCILALLVGGIYLLARKVISWHAPVCYIATVFLMSLIREGFSLTGALAWVLSGGVVLAAFFMATDYSTTPTTGLGKAVFGIGAGLLTVLIRFFGAYPEGASFAILIMNILTPYIDKFTARRPFGAGGAAK